jgi:tetratricopeptide (TPR) repeat protein
LQDFASEHLTADEIGGLIGGEGQPGISQDRAGHAHSCELCRRAIEMHRNEDSRLRQIAEGPRQEGQPECPSAGDWASLAAGLVDPARQDKLLAHASDCDACGTALRAVVEDFSEDMNAGELRAIDILDSSKADWQSDVARRMAQASRPARPIPIAVRTHPAIWLARAAAVVIAVGAGWLSWDRWNAGEPTRLIAQAYGQQRPFDWRLPGAAYGPVRRERGAASSPQKPAALQKAEYEIKEKLEKQPDDVHALDLSAQVEMLEADPETAIATLQHALERKPDDPGLLAALGMAYALRAEGQSRDVDYAFAIENLRRSLKSKPDVPAVVFNLALVYERMYLYPDAIEQWRHYLDLDKSGDWNKEAQRRLAELEQKKKSGLKP